MTHPYIEEAGEFFEKFCHDKREDGTTCEWYIKEDEAVDARVIADWWLAKIQEREEKIKRDLVAEIERMKPILWNGDPNRYLENVAVYNILSALQEKIRSNKEIK